MNAGYSGTPLIKKLGIKPGWRLGILNAPENYQALLGAFPDGCELLRHGEKNLDFAHLFFVWEAELKLHFPQYRDQLKSAGMLWVSWPKKASKAPTDLDENIIREFGLDNGMVDVKVCAVDATWSGLKFVFRLKDRT